jgi:hypothetical protein
MYACLRGRDELAMLRVSEFKILPGENNILFQMKRQYKSLKLDAEMKPVHKPSLVIPGSIYVSLLRDFLAHRPGDLPTHIQDRLLLRPNDKVSPAHDIWYGKKVLGKEFTDHIVSSYCTLLFEAQHPLFTQLQKFTNTSLRKFHADSLSKASAPIIIQQRSLAQNAKHYTRDAQDLGTKIKVAEIVSGKRKSWHDEPSSHSSTYSKENMPPEQKNIDYSSTTYSPDTIKSAQFSGKRKSWHNELSTPPVQTNLDSSSRTSSLHTIKSAQFSGNKPKKMAFSFAAGEASFEFQLDL